MLAGDDILAAQRALGEALVASRPWWAPRPWDGDPPWLEACPALSDGLLALDDNQMAAAAAQPWVVLEGLDWPEPMRTLGEVTRHTRPGPLGAPVELGRLDGVKARKRGQLSGFVGAVEGLGLAGEAIVEGCSGYGHLGRVLGARWGRRVVLLERDAALCVAQGPEVRHVQVDVMSERAASSVPADSLLVGLHACGALSDRLAELAVHQEAHSLALAPCCPHRREGPWWSGMACVTREAGLRLSPLELRLAVRDDGVSSDRRQRLRAHRRLTARAFRHLANLQGRPVPRPRWPRSAWDAPYEVLIDRITAEEGLGPTDVRQREEALSQAIRDIPRLARLELVRFAAREALERWTVLDRAAWLVEQGWAVRVGTFCETADSPRRTMIAGDRPHSWP